MNEELVKQIPSCSKFQKQIKSSRKVRERERECADEAENQESWTRSEPTSGRQKQEVGIPIQEFHLANQAETKLLC